jgi:hypothetical protein
MFEGSYNPANGVITLKTSGFHKVGSIAENQEQGLALVARAKREHGRSRTLIMGDGLLVQAGAVIDHCAGVLDRFKPAKPGEEKVALVLSSALVRLQLAKLFTGDDARIFSSVEDANAWLLADENGPSSAV